MMSLNSENLSIILDHHLVKDRMSSKVLGTLKIQREDERARVTYDGDPTFEREALLSLSQYLIHVEGITDIDVSNDVGFSNNGIINQRSINQYATNLPLVQIAVPILKNAEGAVLIGMRPTGAFMPGVWEFPGGKIEPGESPAQAGIRELKEETGVDIASVKEICAFHFVYLNNRLQGHISLATDWQGEPKCLHHADLRWIKPAELPEYPTPLSNVLIFKELLKAL